MIASTASSSCSIRLLLAIDLIRFWTQLVLQILQAAKLKLLDGALAAPYLARDLAYTLFLCESHNDHPTLIDREPIHQFKEPRPPFDPFQVNRIQLLGSRYFLLPGD